MEKTPHKMAFHLQIFLRQTWGPKTDGKFLVVQVALAVVEDTFLAEVVHLFIELHAVVLPLLRLTIDFFSGLMTHTLLSF